LQHNEPWKLIKSDPARCNTVVNTNLQLAYLLATVLEPYLPSISRKILSQLAAPLASYPEGEDHWQDRLKAGHKIGTPEALFRKLTQAEIETLKARYAGPVREKFPADLRVGIIEDVENHPSPEAQKLYKLGIRVDPKTVRTIVSGLREYYGPDELKGRRVVVLCNLKAQKFKGLASQGMVLVAEKDGKLELLAPGDVAVGTAVLPQGQTYESPAKFDVKEFAKLSLICQGGAILMGAKPLLAGDRPISTSAVLDGVVK